MAESSLPRGRAPEPAVAPGHHHGFRRVQLCLHRRGRMIALEWIAFHCMQDDFFDLRRGLPSQALRGGGVGAPPRRALPPKPPHTAGPTPPPTPHTPVGRTIA